MPQDDEADNFEDDIDEKYSSVKDKAIAYLTDDTATPSASTEVETYGSGEALMSKKSETATDENEEKKEDEPEAEPLPPTTASTSLDEEPVSESVDDPEDPEEEIETDDIVLQEIASALSALFPDALEAQQEDKMESLTVSSEVSTEIVTNDGGTRDLNEERKESLEVEVTNKEEEAATSPRWWNKMESKKGDAPAGDPTQTVTPWEETFGSRNAESATEEATAEAESANEVIRLVETIDQPSAHSALTPPVSHRSQRSPSPPPPPPRRAPSPHRRNPSPSPQQRATRSSRRSVSPAPRVRAPSPQRVALVEHRRAVRSRDTEARNAIGGELGISESKHSDDIANRSRKVRFRQRYPVPPLIRKPRAAEDIAKDNQVGAPDHNLHLAKPKKDLEELLLAVTGSSLQRRSNACGALKVLTTQKKNKLTLVRTAGFLDALVFAADAKLSNRDNEAALNARTRAIACILNVSEPKDNRVIVFSHKRVPKCLVKCIVEDQGEARTAACGALALLAKTPYCRELMAKVPKMLDILAIILKGANATPAAFLEEADYSGDDEASEGDIQKSFSSDSESSCSSLGGHRSSRSQDFEDVASVMSMRRTKLGQTKEVAKRARVNVCAALVHLSKQCSVLVSFHSFIFFGASVPNTHSITCLMIISRCCVKMRK
jgi:hypothetical protein